MIYQNKQLELKYNTLVLNGVGETWAKLNHEQSVLCANWDQLYQANMAGAPDGSQAHTMCPMVHYHRVAL